MPNTIILQNDLSEIRRLHRSVARFAEMNRLADDITADIRIVIVEVFSNIVQYGFDDEENHYIAGNWMNTWIECSSRSPVRSRKKHHAECEVLGNRI